MTSLTRVSQSPIISDFVCNTPNCLFDFVCNTPPGISESVCNSTPGFSYVCNNPHAVSDFMFQVDRKSTRLNSSHANISYAVFCLKKKKYKNINFLLL